MARGMADKFSPQRLRHARERADGGRGISEEELARRIGAKRAEIAAYEQSRSRPEPARIRALAAALGVYPLDLSEESRLEWTLADLRRASGWTARSVSRELQVSERSYRRLETEGLEPARQRGLVRRVAVLLQVGSAETEECLSRSPGVHRRLGAVEQALRRLLERCLRPGCLDEPHLADAEIICLAALYHCPVSMVARILAQEISLLREMHRREAAACATADYAPTREEQALARKRADTESERITLCRTQLPGRLDAFFRQMLTQDSWHTLHTMQKARTVRTWWSRAELPGTGEGLDGLPFDYLEEKAGPVVQYRLSGAGHRHCVQFGSWYNACYPSAAARVAASVALLTGYMPSEALTSLLASCDTLLFSFDALLCHLFADDLKTVSDLLLHTARDLGLSVSAHRPSDPVGVFRALLRQATRSQTRRLDQLLASAEMKAARDAVAQPSIAALLQTLAHGKWRLAIVTDHSAAAVRTFITRLPLPAATRRHITIVGRSSHPARMKPHPHTLTQALQELGGSFDRTVLVGGSPLDAAAAQRARITFIGVAPAPRAAALRGEGVSRLVPSWRTLIEALPASTTVRAVPVHLCDDQSAWPSHR